MNRGELVDSVQINKDRAAAELSAVAAMTEGAGRAELLQSYAAQVVGRAADAGKRAALVAESNYALLKWGAA